MNPRSFHVSLGPAARRAFHLAALALAALAPPLARPALAGGGPENVALVVNSASWASQTVANYYARLRAIPPSNVLPIQWRGSLEQASGEEFRQKILLPVLGEIEKRGLAGQIDLIVYSSDFPWSINLAGDYPGVTLPPQASAGCSITSCTYQWQAVLARSPSALAIRGNRYMRAARGRTTDPVTRGFRSWYGWGEVGQLQEAAGEHYFLSTMLAMTSGRGNSVREAVAYLTRSAAADGSHPPGTIYYSRTGDVRSKTRQGDFDAAIDDLRRAGVRAEVVDSALPGGKRDVMGVMAGVSDFNWPASGSEILPGAFCEHLTSFGGILAENGGQTPLTEWLRRGAAGSCGTVIEPYAMQDKFPVAALHVHYARGCTLAEAFYQSVFGPFQLLIVGDPLCRPWANIPHVRVAELSPGQTVKGTVRLRPTATLPRGGQIDRFELFVDGRRQGSAYPGHVLPLDTASLEDGYHEVRVVAIERSDIESQGRAIIPLRVANGQRRIEVTARGAPRVGFGQLVKLAVRAPGATRLVAHCGGRAVAEADGDQAELNIDTRLLGSGPVSLGVVALGAGTREHVLAEPVELNVQPVPISALANPPVGQLVAGMQLKPASGPPAPVQSTRESDWLAKAGVKPGEAYSLEGYFTVPATDAYQFQLYHRGDLRLSVDGNEVYRSADGKSQWHFAPLALAQGLHHLELAGKATGLQVRFGGPGARSLSGSVFRHPQ